jgi:hypothetical protein
MFCFPGAVRCSGCPEIQASPGPPDQSHNSASGSDAKHMPAPRRYSTCFVRIVSSIVSLDTSSAAALHRPIAKLRSMTLAGCDFASAACLHDQACQHPCTMRHFAEADTTRMWTWLSDSEYETTGLTTGSNSGRDMSAASHALSAVAAVTIAKTTTDTMPPLRLERSMFRGDSSLLLFPQQ